MKKLKRLARTAFLLKYGNMSDDHIQHEVYTTSRPLNVARRMLSGLREGKPAPVKVLGHGPEGCFDGFIEEYPKTKVRMANFRRMRKENLDK